MSLSNFDLKSPATDMETSSTQLRPSAKMRAVKRRKLRSQRLRRQQR
jgi:hypothetical protein